jgi:hypothetical protein
VRSVGFAGVQTFEAAAELATKLAPTLDAQQPAIETAL